MCSILLEILALAVVLCRTDAQVLSTSSSALYIAKDTATTKFLKIKRDESGCLGFQPTFPDVKRDFDYNICLGCLDLSEQNKLFTSIITDSSVGVNLDLETQDDSNRLATSIPEAGPETPNVFLASQDAPYQVTKTV